MNEKQIRRSFVSCSRREAAQVALHDVADVRCDRLGWVDRRAPLRAHVVLAAGAVGAVRP